MLRGEWKGNEGTIERRKYVWKEGKGKEVEGERGRGEMAG